MLDHFARLAANAGQTSMAVIGMLRHRLASRSLDLTFGLSLPIPNPKLLFDGFLGHWDSLVTIPDVREDARVAGLALIRCLPEVRFLVYQPVLSPGNKPIGFILLLDGQVRTELTTAQRDAVDLVASALTTDRRREQRQRHLMHVADRALRADRILRLVSEAPSCAAALTSLLEELCLFHNAAVGRIWQLTVPSDRLREISRYHATAALGAFFDAAPALPITTQNSMTARSIQSNIPHAIVYAEVERPEELALLEPARACGLTCQVSMPIWVQQQRFSIALAFTAVRHDLHSVMTDIASLANTIRPTLFRKVAEEHIRFVAHHDDLTQLANRVEFNERLSDAIFHARQGDTGLALIYLDLDGFKMVNDAQGHEAGDKLLAAFAARLRDNTREGDIVARMGGDEFAIIQRVDGQPLPATALAQRLLETVEQPFYIDGQRAQVGVSIGISVYPMNGDTPDLLLRNADTAMYRAKEAGRNTFRLFDPAMAATRQQRLVVEQDLRTAIEEEQFTLAYQPICDTDSLQLRGFEALLRWNHPTRGQVQPSEFVYLAERTGLIMPLGHWVLKEACAEAAGWNPACFISVNLSPRQFRQPDFPEQIAEMLARSGMRPERLDLEVTEGLLLDSSGLVLRNMRALREQGISITLDDFGTAYASLAYLRRFPFDQIKIDKSFIQGMCSDQHTLAIVRAILSLARELNLTVIAEGVETPQELEMLRNLGCRLIQGFLPGRPMPREQARLLPGVSGQTNDRTGSHQTVAFTPAPP